MKVPEVPSKSILGLSFSDEHDSTISIVGPDGEVFLATSSERHLRVKQRDIFLESSQS